MKYEYLGFDRQNQMRVTGDIESYSKAEVARTLDEQGIDLIKVTPLIEVSNKGKKVTTKDLVLPLRELATLSNSGVSLVDAIDALAKNKEHPRMALGFKKIAAHIEAGGKFSEAISESDLPFPDYLAQLVNAGELGGQLKLALDNAATQMEYDLSIQSDIKSALTYPLVLVGSGLAAMLIIFFAVVPKFSHLLAAEQELPALAYLVLSAGKAVNDSPYVIIGAIALLVFAFVSVFLNAKVQTFLMNKAILMPVIGPWLEEQDTAKWASLTAAMLSARVSLVAALTLAAQSSPYTTRRKRALNMVQDVESGESFAQALLRSRLVPATSQNLITVGDKTGQLAKMLQAVAHLHDRACKRRMKQVLTLMEPFAILIVGVLIGIMILGIVMAIVASTDIPL